MKWHWEHIDAGRSGSSGDLAKLFKNEGIKQPGDLAIDAPRPDATLLAREVIQNSWDAARELQAQFADEGDYAPDFSLEFRYEDLEQGEKQTLAEVLGLDELRARVDDVGDEQRAALGLAPSDVLASLHDPAASLSVLKISETATTGMFGPFVGAHSKLYLALVSIGFTAKATGSGGSYGYGKAGLIRGSSTRTVVAYTCFREETEGPNADPGVTRRLLGMTYWGLHEIDGTEYTGFARFGKEQDSGVVEPWINEEADAIAENLGLSKRDPGNLEDLGTIFLVVDPTVEPGELKVAIERNWWPAITENCFAIDIFDVDGTRVVPQPKQDPFLRTFIDAFQIAKTPQDNPVDGKRRKALGQLLAAGRQRELGTLGLVSDVASWSYPSVVNAESDDEESVAHRSLVALVRGPRMVVEYFVAGQSMPYVRGVFVADDDVDDLLRQTEPKAHDAWDTSASLEGITDADAPGVARKILNAVKYQVNDFRRAIRPPVPKQRDIRLPELENLFKQVLQGQGPQKPGPDPAPRDVAIQIKTQRVVPASEGRIQLEAAASFALSGHVEDEEALAKVRLRYVFLEDDRAGEECDLDVVPPPGFDAADKGFVGNLTHDPVVFTCTSAAYDHDWTGRLVAVADLVALEEEAEAET